MSQQSTRAAAGTRRTLAPLLVAGFTVVVAVAGASAPAAGAPLPACSAAQGQQLIDEGRYKQAVKELTCVIDAEPTEVEGYRGRIEALLLIGQYSDAVRDYARVTAFVLPVHPDAASIILSGYDARLAVAPQDIPALTGASFARWWFFQYAQAIQLLNQLIAVRPDDLYGNLFRGSSRMLGGTPIQGAADLETAIALSSTPSPSCSLRTGRPLWAATTISSTSRRSSGSPAQPGPTGCWSLHLKVSALASWS